ncbi:sce7726 family protein [Hymenobacter sp. NST-14]|uniref:sce7726 family protein n=1 Tax=Hymenobacter piscis TaxID=2839984 RepID=UPI001C03A0D4|nr:sce7726 family protein [Hymenobacter piscis]MBT9394366.1 sce7726 family protein [Hymenobacter piscis]
MNDSEIRRQLYPQLAGGVHIDELDTGATRADVVHITSESMHCYELKGDGDTLKRAETQLFYYARAFDYVTFIVTERHQQRLQQMLPAWVGITVASGAGLVPIRVAQVSPLRERGPLALLLLGSEIKQFLRGRGEKGLSKLRDFELSAWLTAADHIPLEEISQYVRRQLIERLPQRLRRREVRRQLARDQRAARQANRQDLQQKMRQWEQDEPEWYAQHRAYYEAELARI